MRDALTTTHEQALLRAGGQTSPTLSREAVLVDAIVNTGAGLPARRCLCCSKPLGSPAVRVEANAEHDSTCPSPSNSPTCSAVGFPLVGGPAGTMEGGRQSEIAKAILGSKNVPYVVAAPLLIQVGLGA